MTFFWFFLLCVSLFLLCLFKTEIKQRLSQVRRFCVLEWIKWWRADSERQRHGDSSYNYSLIKSKRKYVVYNALAKKSAPVDIQFTLTIAVNTSLILPNCQDQSFKLDSYLWLIYWKSVQRSIYNFCIELN